MYVRHPGSNKATPKYLSLLQEKPQNCKNSQLVLPLSSPAQDPFCSTRHFHPPKVPHLFDALFERLEHTVSTGSELMKKMPNQMGVVDETLSPRNKSRMRHPPIVPPLYRLTGMLVHDGRVRGGVEGKDFEVRGPNGASWRLWEGERGRETRMEDPEIGQQLTRSPLNRGNCT